LVAERYTRGSYEVLVYYQQPCVGENSAGFSIAPVVDGTFSAVEGSLLRVSLRRQF
jgi:hypothetical protein